MKRIITALLSLLSLASYSATYTTISDGKWNQSSTWLGGLIPSVSSWSSDVILISHKITKVPDISLSGPTILTVGASGVLDGGNGSGNTFNITVGEQAQFINQGTINNAATIQVNSNAKFDFQSGTITANYLTVSGGQSSNNTLATFTSNGALTINNDANIGGSGKFDMQSNVLTVGGSFTSTGGDTYTNLAGTVTIKGDLNNTGSSKMNSSAVLSAKSFTNSGSSSSSGTYFKSTGKMTITNNFYNQAQAITESLVTVGGSSTNDWGAKMTINNNQFNVQGSFTNNGYIDGNGIFTWIGTITQGYGAITHPMYKSDITGPSVPPSTPTKLYNLGDVSPLPVRILDFAGDNQQSITLFRWTTTMEENFDHFQVEMSKDAKHFQSIGSVATLGNGKGENNYTFSYNQPYGTYYFRLKAVDVDGEAEYLKIISVTRTVASPVSVYPNPVTHQQLTINLGQEFNHGVVKVYDRNGMLALEHELPAIESTLSLDALRPNIYYVVIITDASISRTRIIVQ